MPLLAATLQEELLKILDKAHVEFVGFPETGTIAGINWSRAAKAFFLVASIPSVAILIPGAHDLAESAMASTMASILGVSPSPLGALALQQGFQVFAATLAASVLPGVGALVPPPSLFTMPLLPPVASALPPAIALAANIYAWSLTGTFTPLTPPGSPPIPWL